jgi:hypothetical protein
MEREISAFPENLAERKIAPKIIVPDVSGEQ